MYETILVPTDGSDVARTAVDNAIVLAERYDADLHVIHVLGPSELPPGVEDVAAGEFAHHGERAVESAAELAIQSGVELVTDVLTPPGRTSTHREILDYAARNGVDCIVMGTHGRRGVDRYLLGSVTEQTVRDSPVPVMTVHEDTVVNPNFENILLPTDGSDAALVAAEHAIDLAEATGASLHVVSVLDFSMLRADAGGAVSRSLEEAGERALASIVERTEGTSIETVTTSVESGVPYKTIVEYATENQIDCIVMGTHGRTGIDHFLLGSVTERVVRIADIPVWTIRAPRADDQ